MATTNNNNIVNGLQTGQGFSQVQLKVSHSTFPINQGDLVQFDNSANIAKVLTNDASAANLAGVALQPSAASSNLDNSGAPAEKAIQVGFGVIARFKTTAAETYTDGDAMYIGADAQTVTTVVGTNMIGRVLLPSNVASVTGATGVTVPVIVFAALPVKFGL